MSWQCDGCGTANLACFKAAVCQGAAEPIDVSGIKSCVECDGLGYVDFDAPCAVCAGNGFVERTGQET